MQCEKGWFIETGSTGTACLFLHRSQRVFCPGCLSHTHFVSSREDKGIKLCVCACACACVCVCNMNGLLLWQMVVCLSVSEHGSHHPLLSRSLWSLSHFLADLFSILLSLYHSVILPKPGSCCLPSDPPIQFFSAQFRGLKAGQEECVSNET